MRSYQVNILNPKADKLLRDLADMKLITLSEASKDSFMKVVDKLRRKAASQPPSLDEITREVEAVRAKRYANKTKT